MTTFVEPQTVNEFHTRRRMFAIVDGTLRMAPERWPYTHAEWLQQDHFIEYTDDPRFATLVRGFYLPGWHLVAYQGIDFEGWKSTVDALLPHLAQLKETCQIPDDTFVFVGMKPSGSILWTPHKRVGRVGALLDREAES